MNDAPNYNASGLQHLAALQANLCRLSTSSKHSRHLAVLLATTALLLSFSKLCSRDALFWLMVPVALLAWTDAYQSHLRQVFTTRYDAFLRKLFAANGSGRIKEEDVPSLAVPQGLEQVMHTLKAGFSVAILPFYGGLLLLLLVLGNGWDQGFPNKGTKASAHAGCGGSCGGCGASGGCGSGGGGCGGACGGGRSTSVPATASPGKMMPSTPRPMTPNGVPVRPSSLQLAPSSAPRPISIAPVPNQSTLAPRAPAQAGSAVPNGAAPVPGNGEALSSKTPSPVVAEPRPPQSPTTPVSPPSPPPATSGPPPK